MRCISIVLAIVAAAMALPAESSADADAASILGAVEGNWPEAQFEARINDGSTDRFKFGERLAFHFSASQSAHVTLIHVDSRGTLTAILPSAWENRIPAGGTLSFPPPAERFFVHAQPPAGPQSLFAIATKEPLDPKDVGLGQEPSVLALEGDAARGAAERLAETLRARPHGSIAVARLDHRILPAPLDASTIVALFDDQRRRGIPEPMVPANVNFEFDSDRLGSGSKEALDEFGKAMKAMGSRSFQSALLDGHADVRGTEEYNLDLSRRRAESVRAYLIQAHGLDADLLSAYGYGEQVPLDPSDSEEAHAVNRRVELKLID